MLFTSLNFLFLFLPAVFVGFLFLSYFKQEKMLSFWLLLASIAFYGFWNPWDLLPLSISIIINYAIYLIMIKANLRFQKPVLIFGIAFNLLFLANFKYLSAWFPEFFSQSLEGSSHIIPLGISFYTFTQIAFLVDCYKERYEKNDFVNYSLFVSYFPHLVCGPILSFKDLYPQLTNSIKFKPSLENVSIFIFCFSIGVFKKTFIGDSLGQYADVVFAGGELDYLGNFSSILWDFKTAFLGVLCYSLQLYFDFSGYSDMAVGLSYLFGLKIPDNFNTPYQATSIIDFWRRWHITLSNFLKNYVYIPLGGNKVSFFAQYRNLWITMLLGGLWHGASLTFLIWGAYHGALLSINHLIRKLGFPLSTFTQKWLSPVKIGLTFFLVALGWVLFRSPTLQHAMSIYKSLFMFSEGTTQFFGFWKVLVLALLIAFFFPDTLTLREKFVRSAQAAIQSNTIITSAVICGILSIFGVLCFSEVQHFLYSGF